MKQAYIIGMEGVMCVCVCDHIMYVFSGISSMTYALLPYNFNTMADRWSCHKKWLNDNVNYFLNSSII